MRKDVTAPKPVQICNMCQGTGKVEVIGLGSGQKVWHDCLCLRKRLQTKSRYLVPYDDCG